MANPKDQMVLRIHEDLHEELKDYAEKHYYSIRKAAERFIRQGLDAEKEKIEAAE